VNNEQDDSNNNNVNNNNNNNNTDSKTKRVKVYLQKHIKMHSVWKISSFWEEFFFDSYQIELAKQKQLARWHSTQEQRAAILREKNILFSQLCTLAHNMIEFDMPVSDTIRFVKKMCTVNELDSERVCCVFGGVMVRMCLDVNWSGVCVGVFVGDTGGVRLLSVFGASVCVGVSARVCVVSVLFVCLSVLVGDDTGVVCLLSIFDMLVCVCHCVCVYVCVFVYDVCVCNVLLM